MDLAIRRPPVRNPQRSFGRTSRMRSSAATSADSDRYGIRFPGCQLCPAAKLSRGCGLARRSVQMQQPRRGPRSPCRPRSRRVRTCGSGRFPRATGPRRYGDLSGRVSRRSISARSQCTPTRKTSRPTGSVARSSRQARNSMMCSTMRSFPAAASADRHRWKPSKNRGRICCHQANGPSGSRRAGSMPLATR